MHIVMLTSQHPPKDVRLYEREALSLTESGHNVTIVYMGDNPPSSKRNVAWIAVPKPSNRFLRVLLSWKIAIKAKQIKNADIFIIYDAEILYLAPILRLITGAQIVYNCLEPSPYFIADKQWVPIFFKGIVRFLVFCYEYFFSIFCNGGVITVVENVNRRFARWGRNAVMIRNFPRRQNIPSVLWGKREKKIIYIGLITYKRQIKQICNIAECLPNWQVEVWGPTYEQKYVEEIITHFGKLPNLSFNVKRLPYDDALKKMSKAKFGLSLLSAKRKSAHQYILSSKLFDYMMVGTIPIATDTEPNRRYLENGKYGFLVYGKNGEKEIAQLIREKMKDPNSLEKMSEECRTKAQNDYCWEKEAKTLIKFIDEIKKKTIIG